MELVFAIVRRVIPSNTALCIHARVMNLRTVLLDDYHYRNDLVVYLHHDESSDDQAIAPYKVSDSYRYPFVHTTIRVLSDVCRYRGADGYPKLFPVTMYNARVGPFIADFFMGSIIVWNLLAVEYDGTAATYRADCGHQHVPINDLCSRCTIARCMRCCQRAHGMLHDVYTTVRPVVSAGSMTCSCGTPPSLFHTFHAEPMAH